MRAGGCGSSACQKIVTNPQVLATFGSIGKNGGATFRVPMPDSRLRVKITILFVPNAGAYPSSGLANTCTLWLCEAEQDISGVSGSTFPCANIEGTSGTPSQFPVADGLLGYTREFISAADDIEGTFNCATSLVGNWVLQCRYQPDSVRFTDAEWQEIASQCNPSLTSQPARVS